VLFKAGLLLLMLSAEALLSPEERGLLDAIGDSGRCTSFGSTPDARVSTPSLISPGPPPLLSFRFYEGKLHGRFGNAELMLDDAGH
jgi:hypothetical protein